MGEKNRGERFSHLSLHILFSLAIVCGFLLFGTMTIQARAECTVEFNGGIEEKTVEYYCIYQKYIKKHTNGDTLKIRDDGKEYNFTYYYNDFFDKDWNSLAESGYGIVPEWQEEYEEFDDFDLGR